MSLCWNIGGRLRTRNSIDTSRQADRLYAEGRFALFLTFVSSLSVRGTKESDTKQLQTDCTQTIACTVFDVCARNSSRWVIECQCVGHLSAVCARNSSHWAVILTDRQTDYIRRRSLALFLTCVSSLSARGTKAMLSRQRQNVRRRFSHCVWRVKAVSVQQAQRW